MASTNEIDDRGLKIISLSGAEEFRKEIPKLFNVSKEEILITTGLYSEFYMDYEVRESLYGAIERGVKIKIIVDGDKKNDSEELSKIPWMLNEIKKGKIKIRKCKSRIRHVMIVDKVHARTEKPHPLEARNEYKNRIFYNDPLAEFLANGLNLLWDDKDKCEDIELPK
ncbi:MAG: hypothetical protein CVT89_02985 [Candidatus Altiarchaeales archaeon HGW-Altiarchaeales-2]|nr:MAG: hypothetical protein CVT89_02985 [Candidatus Altiarchaeales archaeon HGW-Altiarchaeales-2]